LWAAAPPIRPGIQLERQTELARQVQMDLLPAADSVFKGLDFAAVCVPAQQVGGDFYDVFADGDRRIAIVLWRRLGQGLPASVVSSAPGRCARQRVDERGNSTRSILRIRLSETLAQHGLHQSDSQHVLVLYEPDESHVLRYINAGHLPPLLVRRADRPGTGSSPLDGRRSGSWAPAERGVPAEGPPSSSRRLACIVLRMGWLKP